MNVTKLHVSLDEAGLHKAQFELENFLFLNCAGDETELKAVLILKEVFGNAHRHGTGGEFSCRYRSSPAGTEMRYCYATTPFESNPAFPDVLAETGRGLLLIHELADSVSFAMAHHHAQVDTRFRAV